MRGLGLCSGDQSPSKCQKSSVEVTPGNVGDPPTAQRPSQSDAMRSRGHPLAERAHRAGGSDAGSYAHFELRRHSRFAHCPDRCTNARGASRLSRNVTALTIESTACCRAPPALGGRPAKRRNRGD
jgi:hypothetical protein